MFRIPSHLFPCRSASTEKLLCSNLFSWKNSSCTVWQRRLSDSSAVFRAGVFTIVTGMWPQLPGLLASAVWASSFFTCTSSSCESHSHGQTAYGSDRHHCSRSCRVSWSQSSLALLQLHVVIVRVSLSRANSLR